METKVLLILADVSGNDYMVNKHGIAIVAF